MVYLTLIQEYSIGTAYIQTLLHPYITAFIHTRIHTIIQQSGVATIGVAETAYPLFLPSPGVAASPLHILGCLSYPESLSHILTYQFLALWVLVMSHVHWRIPQRPNSPHLDLQSSIQYLGVPILVEGARASRHTSWSVNRTDPCTFVLTTEKSRNLSLIHISEPTRPY